MDCGNANNDYERRQEDKMYEMKPEYYIGIDMIDEEHK